MKESKRNFAVFILTHGRADNVITYHTLRKQGYTGRVFFIVDNLDDQIDQYRKNFGADSVIVFDKTKAAKECDTMDNSGALNVILFARNESFRIAKDLGLTHFLELDDDYTGFSARHIEGKALRDGYVNLDVLFDSVLDALDETGAATIALAQGGDFIGGANGGFTDRVKRKAMNSFFCRVDRPIRFLGRINEDVNTYTYWGSRGMLFFTITEASLVQMATQQNKGGMTDTYLDFGTFIKSFYTVMVMPSAVKVSVMGDVFYRYHHLINWRYCVPKIIDEKYKKR